MSLSPFDSFQSRFVTYLLNRPRIVVKVCQNKKLDITAHYALKHAVGCCTRSSYRSL